MGYGYLAPGRSKPRGYVSNLLSGYDPLVLSPDIWIESRYGLYTDAGVTPAEDMDLIYRIADELSGNTNNYDQATSGKRATLAYENGKPYINSTAVNEFYDRGGSYTCTGNFFLSVVVKASVDSFYMINNSAGGQHRCNRSGVANKVSILIAGAEGVSNDYSGLSSWTIITVRRTGTNVEFFEGLTPRGSYSTGLTHETGNYIMGWSAGFSVNGLVALIFGRSTLDDENLAGLTGYLEDLIP